MFEPGPKTFRMEGDVPVWGTEVFPEALAQIRNASREAAKVAMMADHHVGYGVPIGGVVAYYDRLSPTAVGYDISCGNKAVRLDVTGRKIRPQIHKIMDDVWKKVSFGMGRNNAIQIEHPMLDNPYNWQLPICKSLRDRAASQLGTVGGGNHYVDIFTDELDAVWIGVHFGSRGFGHGIATHYIEAGTATGHILDGIITLHDRSALGEEYIEAMRVVGEYAYAGRDVVVDTVAKIIGGKILEEVHNHHNYQWKEEIDGETYWVARKGATPAYPGQKGVVGATMTEPAAILEGVESEMSKLALYSTVHGAGRLISRSKAKGNAKKGISGMISERAMKARVQEANIVLRGADVDEAPQAYKRLDEVLACHAGTVKILHTLTPIGVAMAGPDTKDPYKD